MKPRSLVAILNAVAVDYAESPQISGGDRILFEALRNWQGKLDTIELLTCTSGLEMLEDYSERPLKVEKTTIPVKKSLYKNLLLLYLLKTIRMIRHVRRKNWEESTILFTSSDFFPDVLPAVFAKFRHPQIRWVAAFYFFAPRPFSSDFPYKGLMPKLRGVYYYLTQKFCYALIKRYADAIVACNEIDRAIMIDDKYEPDKIHSIYGGVDLKLANSVRAPRSKKYDAIFMARLHPQKGPLEALRAWKVVMQTIPKAKLAMIGSGDEEAAMKEYIAANSMESNVTLLGFADGKKKYQHLKAAKLFLHSAIYETGGMAAAEGMSAGLPVVAFDHEGFDHSYPKGIVRVSPVGDVRRLAEQIVELLRNTKRRNKVEREATQLIKEWDWPTRSSGLLKFLSKV